MYFDLEFEQPLEELVKRMDALQCLPEPLPQKQIQQLSQELQQEQKRIYSQLTAWQTVQVARHKNRPYTADYIRLICQDFYELHGDRLHCDDPAILGGLASLSGYGIMVVGHQKGRSQQEKQFHNFGMPHPEGYRKAHRLMQLAEKFQFPLICLIDTPGAFPSLEDEEHGQSRAIAMNLGLMAQLRVPIIAVVIGEGGSGGALAISLSDRILMLEHSIYTVAAPEAAASILWRDTAFAPEAAKVMKIQARDLLDAHVIDAIIPEPLGGAHRDYYTAASNLKQTLLIQLDELCSYSMHELLEKRYEKYRRIGQFGSVPAEASPSTTTVP